MFKDVGMVICKSIAVTFLSCLVVFWRFHPFIYLFLLFFGGDKRINRFRANSTLEW